MIEVKDLTKIYGGLKAVNGISFTARKGEILGFLGPNGAGKTTTMRILAGSLGATSGSAQVAGFEVHSHPKEVKRRLGYMPEFPPLYNSMTVHGYMAFAARIKGVPRAKRVAAVDRAMELCGLTQNRKRIIGQLSKGYRQRVGLAQALVHEPEVLVLDEPTSGLDPAQISDVRKVIKSLKGDHTVILSTHILPEVTMTCDRVVVINKGQILAVDTEKGLAQKVASQRQLVVRLARPAPECQQALWDVEGVQQVVAAEDEGLFQLMVGEADPREEVARTVVDGGWGLLELGTESASLEDIYLKLVAGNDADLRLDKQPVAGSSDPDDPDSVDTADPDEPPPEASDHDEGVIS